MSVSELDTDTMPAICTGIMVTLPAGKFPTAPGVVQRMGTSPLPEISTVAVAANWMPPADSKRSPSLTVPLPVTCRMPDA